MSGPHRRGPYGVLSLVGSINDLQRVLLPADLAIGGSIAHGIVGAVVVSVLLMDLSVVVGVLVFVIRLIRKRTVRPAYV